MAGPVGMLASALLPLFRFVTARLEAAALSMSEPPPAADDARMMALRERYPDAPDAWIEFLAARLADGEALQPEPDSGPETPQPASRPHAPPSAARDEGHGSTQAAPAPQAIVPGKTATWPDWAAAEAKRLRPVLTEVPALPVRTEGRFSRGQDIAPRPAPDWPKPARQRLRHVAIAVNETQAKVERTGVPAAKIESQPARRPRLRLLPSTPIPADRADVATIATRPRNAPSLTFAPAAKSPAADMPPTLVQPRDAEPRKVETDRPAAPVAAKPGPATAVPARPVARAQPQFAQRRRDAADRPDPFPAVPAADRWPDLPVPPVSAPAREADDGDRLRRLIQDQVERSWNG